MSTRISVIVPVYNCEKTIKRCIESITNQNYQNIEIIIIDDGSTDKSYDICNELKDKDDRIFLYKKNNGGVSTARNYGLKKATGDYITFIDSDDYLEVDCYKKISKIIDSKAPDIIKFNYIQEGGKKVFHKYITESNKLICRKDYKTKIIDNIFSADYSNVWTMIIKKNVCSDILFSKDITYGEDMLFSIKCLLKSNSIYISSDYYYHYIINEMGITKTFNEKNHLFKLTNLFNVTDLIEEEIVKTKNKFNIEKKYKYDANSLEANLNICIINNNYYKFKKYIQSIMRDSYLTNKIKKIRSKKIHYYFKYSLIMFIYIKTYNIAKIAYIELKRKRRKSHENCNSNYYR